MATQPAQRAPIPPMPMPKMTAYTVQSTPWSSNAPSVIIGVGANKKWLTPAAPKDDSFWFVIFDSNNPTNKIWEAVQVAGGAGSSTVPAGIQTYMDNPKYLFAVATQYLNTLHVPQGALYSFLATYGAGRELQKLEQVNSVLGCGGYGHVGYVLTGQCGKRGPGIIPPTSYEVGSFKEGQAMLLMSLMPQMNGQPPYSICDSYTWT